MNNIAQVLTTMSSNQWMTITVISLIAVPALIVIWYILRKL